MTRLLIIIFAFNAFMTPSIAMWLNAEVPQQNAMMMVSSNTMAMSNMGCDITDSNACKTVHCATSCSSSIPLPTSVKPFSITVAGQNQHQAEIAYFYTIYHPVHTPPPLA